MSYRRSLQNVGFYLLKKYYLMIMNDSLLETIQVPAQLRQLSERELPILAQELRYFLVDTLSRTGGHFASNLGTVELTIALHYVFNTPEDRLVWDVGHQSYPHKILTGRREAMATLRQDSGIAGFPKRSESPYDTFGVGHSSTSISAALGMAIAARQSHATRRVIAIIGDGAMTAGMAFEALNHAGDLDVNLLVILNDNEMSISPNVGGLSNYLAKLLSSQFYTSVRKSGKQLLDPLPPVKELARRTEEYMKGMIVPGTLFEELGFNYIGPIDGHDLSILIKTLNNMKALEGPQILHVITQKGKGFPSAENDPCIYHGVSAFDPKTGKIKPNLLRFPLIPKSLAIGFAIWRLKINALSALRPRCEKVLVWSNFPNYTQNDILMLALLNNIA
jgi:1-deoxy-D-xylulose-5-phosphate synthase